MLIFLLPAPIRCFHTSRYDTMFSYYYTLQLIVFLLLHAPIRCFHTITRSNQMFSYYYTLQLIVFLQLHAPIKCVLIHIASIKCFFYYYTTRIKGFYSTSCSNYVFFVMLHDTLQSDDFILQHAPLNLFLTTSSSNQIYLYYMKCKEMNWNQIKCSIIFNYQENS